MNVEMIINLVVSILSGLVICIPLVYRIYSVVKECATTKNWNVVVSALAKYMSQAEDSIEFGSTRKEWVIGMIRATADSFEYKLTEADYVKLEELCDTLCEMAKVVNTPTLLE